MNATDWECDPYIATDEQVEAGLAAWCADCSASCPHAGTDMLVMCGRFRAKAVRTCDTCGHFLGSRLQEIDFDTGDTMETVQCGVRVFATPDMAGHCRHYRRKGGVE